MQTQISQFISDLAPQLAATITQPVPLMGISLLAPGAIIFAILFAARLARPRWRGYWDAV